MHIFVKNQQMEGGIRKKEKSSRLDFFLIWNLPVARLITSQEAELWFLTSQVMFVAGQRGRFHDADHRA